MVKLLLDYGVDVRASHINRKSALSWAAKQGHDAIVQLILEKVPSVIDMAGFYGRTALLFAASSGYMAIAKPQLENGATISRQDLDGMAPLHHAICNKHQGVAELLVENGAKLDAQDQYSLMSLWE